MTASTPAYWRKKAQHLYPPDFLKLFPDSFVLPQYDGYSLANLPATLGKLLDAPEGWAQPALDASLLKALPAKSKRVMLMVLDGVAWSRLQAQLETNDAGFAELFSRYGLDAQPITSVAPSTTCVATTVLTGNGAMAAETGMMGYQYLLAELGLVANMLFWFPAGQPKAANGSLEAWGIKPEAFIPTPSAAQVLAGSSIPLRVIMPAQYSYSPLSRMQMRGSEIDGYHNATDMFQKMQGWLDDTVNQKASSYVYYADFDTLSHRDGSDAAIWSALWEEFVFQFARFLRHVQHADDTLLVITADHGHLPCTLRHRFHLEDYPDLGKMLNLLPAGEARHLYLYARQGAKDELLAYSKQVFAEQFVVLDAQEALSQGLYGPAQKLHPEASRRLGDVILLSRGKNYFWEKDSKRELKGKHGGLEPDEMLVPLISFQLDR
ncbi:MAG: alkaline phosphatase family protein [Trueperaceae bacterium]|nr:alkaline phosphatase family protein [Trueperaceae bacterium]